MNLITKDTYYTKGYKYRTSESIAVMLPLLPEKELSSDAKMITLMREGLLFISAGYSSDGPSGSTIDTKSFMLGAFVHDALYEMLRQGKFDSVEIKSHDGEMLSREDIRKISDIALRNICLIKNMISFRAKHIVYPAVRKGGLASASIKRKIHKA